jgi:hypothetical protein
MKTSSPLGWCWLAGLAASALCSDLQAHQYFSFVSKPAEAVAVLTTTCYDNGDGPPASLQVSLRSSVKTIYLLTASVASGTITGTTTDKVSGDRLPSPQVQVKGGASTYTITISKTKRRPSLPDSRLLGRNTFLLTYHCLSSTGQHTGTTDIYRSR